MELDDQDTADSLHEKLKATKEYFPQILGRSGLGSICSYSVSSIAPEQSFDGCCQQYSGILTGSMANIQFTYSISSKDLG